jgi:hypothetical protein
MSIIDPVVNFLDAAGEGHVAARARDEPFIHTKTI